MSATTSRTTQGTLELRQLMVALGALILAVALLVAVGVSRQGSIQSAAAPAAAPVLHDRGWATAPDAGPVPVIHDRGWATAGSQSANDFAKAHAPKSAPDSDQLVVKTENGGLIYTGIPYPAPEPVTGGTGGSNGTRFPR